MIKPEISIIVPVYKVEKYLNKCISSILSQTFKDFELILVDDGSPDKCGEICDEYAKKDKRILVIHSQNKGAANARNLGLNTARGKYIGFVDSDDFIDSKMYEKLYKIIITENSDIVFSKIIYFENENKLVNVEEAITEGKIVDIKKQLIAPIIGNRLDKYNDRRIGSNIFRCLFKKEIIIDNKIRLKEGLLYGEDTLFIIEYLNKCNTAYVINDYLYYYRNNPESITNRYKEGFFDSVELYFNYMDKFLELEGYIDDENIMKRLIASKVTYVYWVLINEMRKECNLSNNEKRGERNRIFKSELYKKHYKFLNILKYPLKIRIKMILLKMRLV